MLDRTGNEVQHISQTHDWETVCWTFYLMIITYLLQQFLVFTDNNSGLLRNVLQWMRFSVSDKCKHNNKGKFLHPIRYRLHWLISRTTDPPVFLSMQMSHIGLSLARSTAARTKLLQDPELKVSMEQLMGLAYQKQAWFTITWPTFALISQIPILSSF